MNRGLLMIGLVILGVALFVGGVVFGGSRWNMMGYQPGGMMATDNGDDQAAVSGMMNSGMMGQGMMHGGMMPNSMMSQGMMGSWATGALYDIDPLSLEEAQAAITDYLAGRAASNLAVGEVMIFDNHAYAQIVEQDTHIGAFEVLVDPVTLAVTPEPGPNMMWNTKYSPMSGMGMMGMMMGNSQAQGGMMPGQAGADDMPVTAGEALEAAQRYLDTYLPGTTAGEAADPFYGYYTAHIRRDGQVVGMLSVNGYTRQVFVHTWHGDLVDIAEENG